MNWLTVHSNLRTSIKFPDKLNNMLLTNTYYVEIRNLKRGDVVLLPIEDSYALVVVRKDEELVGDEPAQPLGDIAIREIYFAMDKLSNTEKVCRLQLDEFSFQTMVRTEGSKKLTEAFFTKSGKLRERFYKDQRETLQSFKNELFYREFTKVSGAQLVWAVPKGKDGFELYREFLKPESSQQSDEETVADEDYYDDTEQDSDSDNFYWV